MSETLLAVKPPIRTPVAALNPVPMRVTAVPPAVGPRFGDIDEIVGASKVNEIGSDVPPRVVTWTLTGPVTSEGGIVHAAVVPLMFTVTFAGETCVPPTVTVVAPGMKPFPPRDVAEPPDDAA